MAENRLQTLTIDCLQALICKTSIHGLQHSCTRFFQSLLLMTLDEIPPLRGTWLAEETKVWSGYNTDKEEMDSWSEHEVACLLFLDGGAVTARIGDDETPGFRNRHEIERTISSLPTLAPNGSWRKAERQGHVGYALVLKLPYGIPTFWQSASAETHVFLEPEDVGLQATRFYPGIAWDETPRQIRHLVPWKSVDD